MIVCCCKYVSDKKIRELAGEGHDSLEAIGRACGAGTDCGACRTCISDLIEEIAEPGSDRLPTCGHASPRAA